MFVLNECPVSFWIVIRTGAIMHAYFCSQGVACGLTFNCGRVWQGQGAWERKQRVVVGVKFILCSHMYALVGGHDCAENGPWRGYESIVLRSWTMRPPTEMGRVAIRQL